MPEIDGKQVLSQIRKIETDKKISDQHRVKIIMVTASSEKEIVFDCLRKGCDDFIVKPVDGQLLVNKIKQLGLMNLN
jgi:CheY-like chemotaxis protein